MFTSTRKKIAVTASEAIIKGLSDEGGLFVPSDYGKLNIDSEYTSKGYKGIAYSVLRMFLDDFTDEEIHYVIDGAYGADNFPFGEVNIHSFPDNLAFLELYKGPTLAFKDMALTMLPYLMEVSKRKFNEKRRTMILVATSGDTGGAALSGFKGVKGTDITVLYPLGGVSDIQEKQMLYYTGGNAAAFSYKGNFDDCQTLVKKLFENYKGGDKVILSSANSINIGRLLPQIIYYVYSYCALVQSKKIKLGEKIDFVVPTGNFGNIFAGIIARKIGVPIERFICASNKNQILYDFFTTGKYDARRDFYKTNSPAMDILVSSNLERLLYLAADENEEYVSSVMQSLKKDGVYEVNREIRDKLNFISAAHCDEADTKSGIKQALNDLNYLIDPHTAVAYKAYLNNRSARYTVIVSTASPYKFPQTVAEAIGLNANADEFKLIDEIASRVGEKVPCGIEILRKSEKTAVEIDEKTIEDKIYYRNSFDISTPATSANLSVGFDCIGVAFTINNIYGFKRSIADKTIGFGHIDISKNLVLSSYKRVFDKAKLDYIPVEITMKKLTVPFARGLGSSSCCVVAGAVAANVMLNNYFSKEQLLNIMTEIEGHPDNVAPCCYGGAVASIVDGGVTLFAKYKVSPKLKFIVAIPEVKLATSKARAVLKKQVPLCDAVHNLSRAIFLPRALEGGDVSLLRTVFDDRLHEPYRIPLIDGAAELKAEAIDNGCACCVSGAGSSMLIVSYDYRIIDTLIGKGFGKKWKFEKAEVDYGGAKIIER